MHRLVLLLLYMVGLSSTPPDPDYAGGYDPDG
jgi:hypothetical protein